MPKKNNLGYTVKNFSNCISIIEDANKCSMYLIKGKNRAMLIDTGMTKGDLLPFLKEVTSLPIDLVLTHAHIDHIYHADEFKNVYIFEDEQKNWKKKTSKTVFLGALGYLLAIKKYHVKSYIPLTEACTLPLDGSNIIVYRLQGHTPGSCIFVDKDNEVVFAGDAIGCGIGVWMWLLDACSVQDYKKDLIKVRDILEPYQNFTFLGGHRSQSFEDSEYTIPRAFGYKTIVDMIELCDLVLQEKVTVVKKERAFFFNIYKYEHKSAAIWLKNKIGY